ncbi:DUF6270 domain-containing protein [Cellulomonas sp. ATA003]|uniref:DUF6270 domain-containing protein n=1 Tax=Cellulomonas sp. ATA003 TaxID=3073064 RepID=UPI0028733688|nr:DUF6270 domain-containing protein [Cellulomonas sp. ATA003]WNB85190.1 DUF6270 domain-containing protein [Cellulomonas sp. ATA003]
MTDTSSSGYTRRDRSSRAFVYGSCVSRDSAEFFPGNTLQVLQYVARQSLISAFSPGPATVDLTAVQSPFQRRMLEGDAQGSLPALLERARDQIDLLLWDLTDERLGVLVSTDGHVVTRTVEGLAAGISGEVDGWRLVPFGSDEHFAMWIAALERFTGLLTGLELLERTVLLHVPWAERSDDGMPVPASFGTSSVQANKAYERYYEHAQRSGFAIEALPSSMSVTSSAHRWGAAPFHYTESTYREIVERIVVRVDTLDGD